MSRLSQRRAPVRYVHVPLSGTPASSVDRAFVVLEACAASRRTVSLADLAQLTGLPKSTLHRLCWKLTSLGALEHHDDGFRIGPKLFALGALNPTVQRLRAVSMPFLYELSSETGHISNLAILQSGGVLLIDEVFADERPVPRMVGAMLPVHATALGKALLATQPVDARRALVGDELLPAFTRHTIVRPRVLLDQLEVIARTGISYSHDEWRLGFAGVAAPVEGDGHLFAALALVGMSRSAEAKRYGPLVRRAADALAAALRRPIIRGSSA